MGQAVIFPTHNSLLADYYPVPARPRIYSAHRSGISIGAIVGVLLGAGLASVWTWRAPFFFFAVPIVVVVLIGLRLREPPRGRHEQVELAEQMLASERGEPVPLGDVTAAEPAPAETVDIPVEAPPSLGEAWRTVWKIGVLRRIFIALPFLAAAIAGFTSLASLQYQETFHLDAVQRAFLIAPIQVFDLLGLAVGAVIATRLAKRDIGLVFRMLAVASVDRGRRSPSSSRWPPTSRSPSSATPASTCRWPSWARACWPRSPWPSRPGCARSASPSARSSSCPGSSCSRPSVRWATRSGSATACSSWSPSSSSAASSWPAPAASSSRDVRNVWTSMRTRAQMLRGPPSRAAPPARRPRAQRRLRRRHRARRRRDRDRRGRDRRPGRHQRGRQVDAAAGHRRRGRGRPRRHRLRRPRHHPPAARRDRPPRRRPGPRRRGDLPQPARRRRTCAPRPGRAGAGASATPT